MNPTDIIDQDSLRTDLPSFRAGDTLKVHVRVVEGTRERIQIFQGVVIRRQGSGVHETFTVRKISFGMWLFPIKWNKMGRNMETYMKPTYNQTLHIR